MKSSFNYYMPTKIIFGPGKLEVLSKIELPGKKALIVISSGTAMKKYGYLDKVIECLTKNEIDSVVFDKILPNPIAAHVAEGAKLAKENNCDFVIGLGGGSSIDSAKSIAIMATNTGEYWDYINGGSGKGLTPENKALPIVAIPTTAGTGTESDPWTVITKMDTNEKIGYGQQDTFPVLAIVDPELMTTVPPKLTAYQGMDAFFHAAEGYIAKVSNPSSDLFALESVGLISKNLPIAVNNGDDIEARTSIAWASTASGIVESLSSCTSEHSMEHALSAYHEDLPHGAGLIALSVSYFTFMIENASIPERFINLAKAMGEDTGSLPEKEKPYAFITALKKLIKNIGMEDMRLSDWGIEKSECEKFANNAKLTMGGLFEVDPYHLSLEEIISIYENCFQ